MEKVAEFVENRLHFAMGEQGGLTIDGRAHVADDQSEVGLAKRPGVKRVHPCTAALGFARMPVGIERAKMGGSLRVVNFVKGALGMPDFDRIG